MASERSRILLCLIVCCAGVTARALEDYGMNGYDYESLYQRSDTQQQDEPKAINIAMPKIHPTKHDSYFCTSLKIDDPNTYIVGYQPHAEMHTAHHMLLFGCEFPPTHKKSWNCGDMGAGVCGRGSGEKIMYAWGRNAPVLKLPEDVAFQVGDSNSKYLVLQVHYGHVDKFTKNPKLTDESGVTLKVTKKRQKYSAGIQLQANGYALIPPAHQAFSLNLGCKYENPAVIHPFAFRVHAHSLGTVVTGYRIRNNKWELIGKGDPQRPQAFYPINKDINIKHGDLLAARCTYNTMKRHRTTYIGATMKDEMCNFYMMYYYDPKTTSQPPGETCGYAQINPADYPADSEVPLPGSGVKMEMKRDEVDCPEPFCGTKRSEPYLKEKQNWPQGGKRTGELPFPAGQVTGVSLDTKGNVVIFHRSSRDWGFDTFDNNNVLTEKYRKPITENTVTWLDATTGKVLQQWGAGLFYLPHGLTVDNNDNLWLTDVGSHQVYKFTPEPNGASISNTPSITLGTKLKPGSDKNHFCKPTGVALDSEGNVFVSDGYCNQRVVKYSPLGSLLMVISNKALLSPLVSGPHHFLVPHSASIDKLHNHLYIADRENGRVLVFDTKSGELIDHVIKGFGSRVFAAHYSPGNGGVLHVVNGNDGRSKIKGFIYSLSSDTIIKTWEPREGFEMPHDVASDSTGNVVYVAEVLHPGGRIWKFE